MGSTTGAGTLPNEASGDDASRREIHGETAWQRNLWVCVFGSFTTILGMTLLLPFLPLYVEELGVQGHAAIVQWSGIAFGATFFAASFFAPIWGRLADLYGRKIMLVRASLGMAISISLLGIAQNIWQLVLLRLLVGVLGGYASGSNFLVATQTPKARTGWALGVLSSGIMAGNLVGPLIGGILPPFMPIRTIFFATGGLIFIAFLATAFLIKEEKRAPAAKHEKRSGTWRAIPDKRPVVAMLVTGCLLMFANMSIEPIITVYVATLVDDQTHVTLVAGLAMSATALGSVLSASRLGRLADRVGHWNVLIACIAASAVLLVPQAFVTSGWQLIALRFLMGLALGGLLPGITSVIRHNVPVTAVGGMLGYAVSSQFVGQVAGPLAGGFVGGHFGMRAVFIATSVVTAAGALYNLYVRARLRAEKAEG